ncbi:MAG TPA: hypothetical protein ENK84_09065 [Desulfobulbus sp.]|nr:hypothetical protein [Desulfobulbus sp.]
MATGNLDRPIAGQPDVVENGTPALFRQKSRRSNGIPDPDSVLMASQQRSKWIFSMPPINV